MAVASDLPQLENKRQYGKEVNSYMYDDQGRPIGIFAPPNHDVIDDLRSDLGRNMKHERSYRRRGQALLERFGR